MTKVVSVGLLMAISFSAYSAPFVVSDPTSQTVTHCGYILDGGAKIDSLVAVSPLGKSCKIDIGKVLPGSHSLTASFVNIDPTFGRSESVMTLPFVFAVPLDTLNAPGMLRIVL